jgi:hypothetical protein
MAQGSGYDRFLPVANGWITKHPIPDTVPPFMAEEEKPPTYQKEQHLEINLYHNSRGQARFCHLLPTLDPTRNLARNVPGTPADMPGGFTELGAAARARYSRGSVIECLSR